MKENWDVTFLFQSDPEMTAGWGEETGEETSRSYEY
jgi:hypothetical protein